MPDEKRLRADAYKIGFLSKLAQAGIEPDCLFALTKRAGILESLLGGAGDVGSGLLNAGTAVAGPALHALGSAALLAPIAVGGATGAASALLDAPTDEDIDILRKQELLKTYEHLAEAARQRAVQRAAAAAAPRGRTYHR